MTILRLSKWSRENWRSQREGGGSESAVAFSVFGNSTVRIRAKFQNKISFSGFGLSFGFGFVVFGDLLM